MRELSWKERFEIGKKWEKRLAAHLVKSNFWVDEYELRDEYGNMLPQKYCMDNLENEFHPDLEIEWNDGGRLSSKLIEVKYQNIPYENWGLVPEKTLPKDNLYLYVKKEHFDSYIRVGKQKDVDWDIWFGIPTKSNRFLWQYQDGRYLNKVKIKCKNIFGKDDGWFYLFPLDEFCVTEEFSL